MDTKVLVAKIVNTKGLKGEVKLKSYTQDLLSIKDYILIDKHGVEYKLFNVYLMQGLVVARVNGINSKDEADKIVGKNLYIWRISLPELEDNNYYIIDLIGSRILNDNKMFIGTVKEVYNFGAGDILEIKPQQQKNFMLPFNKDTILSIDIKRKEIVVNSFYKEYM